MKISPQCFPCLVNQAIQAAQRAGASQLDGMLRQCFSYLSEADFQHQTSPELAGGLFAIVKRVLNCPDPYLSLRRQYNQLFLRCEPALEGRVLSHNDPFQLAVRYAICANLVDFGPIRNDSLAGLEQDLPGWFRAHEADAFSIDDTAALRRQAQAARRLLYLADNCGELCMDKLLIRQLRRLNPSLQVTYGVRGLPVLNDTIEADAYEVGMNDVAAVLGNGSGAAGTELHLVSPAFRRAFDQADVIIAKGQGNYESLSGHPHPGLFFLLVPKCDSIAQSLGVPHHTLVCRQGQPEGVCTYDKASV